MSKLTFPTFFADSQSCGFFFFFYIAKKCEKSDFKIISFKNTASHIMLSQIT